MTLDAEVLAKLLVMQTMVSNMPDEGSILGFLCRGLEDVPGVDSAMHRDSGGEPCSGDVQRLFIEIDGRQFGSICVRVTDADAFALYRPYLENLCFMVAVILDGRRLKALTEEHKLELENRVVERTQELIEQIDERKAAEALAMAETERLMVTLQSIGDGVITTDADGRVAIMNPVAEDLTGWKQEDAFGKPLDQVLQLVDERAKTSKPSPVEEVVTTKSVVELSSGTMLVAKDGTERVIADSGAPILDADGVVVGVILVFRDMTEKQRMLEHLRQVDKLESLGLLAGGIAHDFNNLLAGMFGFIDLALTQTDAHSAVHGYLERAAEAFHRARDLTQQLLTFSKGGEPVRKVTAIEPLLKRAVGFALSGSRSSYEILVESPVGPCEIDENQIGQVIDNICINAQQAMPLGGTVTVTARNVDLVDHPALSPGTYAKIALTDTGMGIHQDHLPKIFDPFFTTKQHGSGLGLGTCYSIIKRHDGHIEAKSVLGEGTTFQIYLPVSQKPVQTPLGTKRPAFVCPRPGEKVLVMDDEAHIRSSMVAMLKFAGFDAISVSDGEQAIAACKELRSTGQPLLAAILDLTIPGGLGGKEVVPQLRELYPDLLIFACSGYFDDPVMAEPDKFGFNDSIRKPYRQEELSDLLAAHLNDCGE